MSKKRSRFALFWFTPVGSGVGICSL